MQAQFKGGNQLAQPNVQAYSILINSAAFTNNNDPEAVEEAFSIAKAALKELDECDYDEPNSITYGTFLKACSKLSLPREIAEKEAGNVFKKCCMEGHVNDFVLSQFKVAVSDEMYEQLIPHSLKNEGEDYGNNQWNTCIPNKWSRNVTNRLLGDPKGKWWRPNRS